MSKAEAAQQPDWGAPELVAQVRDELAGLPALVTEHDVNALRAALAEVAAGNAQVLQAGDCAEDPAECTPNHLARKTGLIDTLAGLMKTNTRKPVLRVGRIAGQYAKPRSATTETVNGLELPVYRGHMVNAPEPEHEARRPDPKRILLGYWAAREAMDALRPNGIDPPLWTSHEALLLDYEEPMLRGRLLSSTHWPWIGDRTRQPDGAHVAMLAEVVNPVACKVGPKTTADELLAIVARLDPHREPGRLTLIARMGADRVADRLPPLVRAVARTGRRVIWLCDPMHGNTITVGNRKTRLLDTMIREVNRFQPAVAESGGVAGGLHLEITPSQVTECVAELSELAEADYTTFCDPRLNPSQAMAVVSAWHGHRLAGGPR
ncbi:3-deoxy-7-phosphoheptulonate synthase [Actinophytocola sp.]|uniref:3-deoxy-7-phosphoheptulonate synthase n=1 Tax=Actinophytocola sp. TaxID=1872138 RepID=UPI003899BC1A